MQSSLSIESSVKEVPMAYINKKKIYFAGISKGISERYTEGIIVEDIETEGATSLISFTIDGTIYQAEEGMTWGEWCESDYNTRGYEIAPMYVELGGLAIFCVGYNNEIDNSMYAHKDAVVLADLEWSMPQGGSN